MMRMVRLTVLFYLGGGELQSMQHIHWNHLEHYLCMKIHRVYQYHPKSLP